MSSHHPPAKGECHKCNHRTHGSKQDYCSRTGESVEKVKDTKYCVPAMLKCSEKCSSDVKCCGYENVCCCDGSYPSDCKVKVKVSATNDGSINGLMGCSWCGIRGALCGVAINVTAFSNDPSLDEDVRYYTLCPDCLTKSQDVDYLKSHYNDYINLPSLTLETIQSVDNLTDWFLFRDHIGAEKDVM